MVLTLLSSTPSRATEPISFTRHIRPLLGTHCLSCHGPDEQGRQADLRLDTEAGLAAVIDRDQPESSELLRRLRSASPEEVMPPPDHPQTLTPEHRELLVAWVLAGAPWERHWAFVPPQPPDPQEWPLDHWARQPLDRILLSAMNARGLTPSAEAPRAVLIRRLYLDLLGLLPTPAAVAQFETDSRPDAYERLVDTLLASPHFGERWGRHWLDQARYADSDGYSIDGARTMWPYRDWVLRAINADLPFDQFTIDQLAGDQLDHPTLDQQIASGFHRNTLINQEGGTDPEQFRNEAVVDRVNTTGAVWLGLTLGCAQCHSHKYDPISHQEYYQLFAFFNSDEDINTHAPQVLAAPDSIQQERAHWQDIVRSQEAALAAEKGSAAPDPEVLRAHDEAIAAAKQQIATLERTYGLAMVMRSLSEPRVTHIQTRGDFLRPADVVRPGVPAAFLAGGPADLTTRADLARWLVSPANPLTARVTVNRLWMHYFGRGLVETENDFGTQGTPPSHPELLDWLATELVQNGWSLKPLHRMLVTSAAYRQTSVTTERQQEIDPDNVWYSRQARPRVSAELVRDLALCAAGLLELQIGGPSVFPTQPEGVYAFTQNDKQWRPSEGAQRWRRGMYTFFYRSAPHPFLTTFDVPNFQTACTRRLSSNTPLQALSVANDESLHLAAVHLGRRIQASGHHDSERLAFAFRVCFSRAARPEEMARLAEFLRLQRQELLAEWPDPTASERVAQDAWTAVARALLNLDEFITRN